MKKTLLTVFMLAAVIAANAQGFRFSVKGAYNSTWLFNKNISDAGDELDYKSTFGAQFGVGALYNFTENAGIGIDLLFGSVNQKYTNRDPLFPGSMETQAMLKTMDIPVFFRYTSDIGAYFEIGPQFSILNDGEFETPFGTQDISDDLESSYIAAMIGAGFDIGLTDNLYLTPGIRATYGFGDVMKEPALAVDYEPTNALVVGIIVAFSYKFGN